MAAALGSHRCVLPEEELRLWAGHAWAGGSCRSGRTQPGACFGPAEAGRRQLGQTEALESLTNEDALDRKGLWKGSSEEYATSGGSERCFQSASPSEASWPCGLGGVRGDAAGANENPASAAAAAGDAAPPSSSCPAGCGSSGSARPCRQGAGHGQRAQRHDGSVHRRRPGALPCAGTPVGRSEPLVQRRSPSPRPLPSMLRSGPGPTLAWGRLRTCFPAACSIAPQWRTNRLAVAHRPATITTAIVSYSRICRAQGGEGAASARASSSGCRPSQPTVAATCVCQLCRGVACPEVQPFRPSSSAHLLPCNSLSTAKHQTKVQSTEPGSLGRARGGAWLPEQAPGSEGACSGRLCPGPHPPAAAW